MTTATQKVASPDVMLALSVLDALKEGKGTAFFMHDLTCTERDRLCQSFEQAGWTPNHSPENSGHKGYNSPGGGKQQVHMWLLHSER